LVDGVVNTNENYIFSIRVDKDTAEQASKNGLNLEGLRTTANETGVIKNINEAKQSGSEEYVIII
jgi:hypothetical protein